MLCLFFHNITYSCRNVLHLAAMQIIRVWNHGTGCLDIIDIYCPLQVPARPSVDGKPSEPS